jgi:hypothetical protein
VLQSVVYYGFDGLIHRGQIVIHKQLASDLDQFFSLALYLRFPIAKVIPIAHPKYLWDDDKSCNDNNSSGQNYRLIVGTNRISNHADGRAFDINPMQNPFIRLDAFGNITYQVPQNSVYDISQPGTLTSIHPLVILMRSLGWIWGGGWKPEEGIVDYQHFEKPR